MDLNNLVTVEHSVSYNQTKLEKVIKELESKICAFDQSIKSMDEKCKKLEESETRFEKFQKFTVDNLRMALGQVSTLKMGLRSFLGDEWIKQEEKVEILLKNQTFNKIFESKLSAFYSEAKQLSKRVSQLRFELQNKTSSHEEHKEEVKNRINEQKNQMHKIRESIREGINQKFSIYKKEFEQKNLKQLYKKVQIASDSSMKSFEQMDEKHASAIQKALKQYKRVSITNNFESVGDLPLGKPATLNELESCGKLLMGAQDDNGLQDVIDFESDIRKKKKGFFENDDEVGEEQNNELHHLRMSGLGFLKHLQVPVAPKEADQPTLPPSENLVEAKHMQQAMNQLREELTNMVKTEILEFKSSLEALQSQCGNFETIISDLTNESKKLQSDSDIGQSKLSDLKNEIENVKHSMYEHNQKQNQSLGRILEQESKLEQIQTEIKNLAKQSQSFSNQQQESIESARFKEIQNFNRTSTDRNSTFKTSLYKNSTSTPGLRDENIIISRLNLLSEKMNKLQQKLKNGSFGSDKNLPKISSSSNITTKNCNNTPSVDLLRKDLQKSNDELNKTNQRLENLNKNLRQLEAAHKLIPNRLQKLQVQVTQINEIQEDRLFQLIKELINRVLTDPFNNNFTNTLKRQIHVKFLEIKHQYSSIWKQIEGKVTDRAETSELEKLKERFETQNVEIKALIGKKADNDDFKKGIKYIDTKMKEVYTYLKGKEDFDNSQQGRKYYMGKKA